MPVQAYYLRPHCGRPARAGPKSFGINDLRAAAPLHPFSTPVDGTHDLTG